MKNIVKKPEKNPPCVVILKTKNDIDLIIQKLKNNNIVIANFSSINKKDAHRIVEFVSGFCFAKNGNYRKIDELIYRFEI